MTDFSPLTQAKLDEARDLLALLWRQMRAVEATLRRGQFVVIEGGKS